MTTITIKCLNCGKKFKVKPSRATTAKYHNWQCAQEGRSRSTAKQRADKRRGTGKGKNYIRLRGRYLHVRIAEMYLGRRLRKNEVTHHKDENKMNNDPMNIEVKTRAEHLNHHRQKLIDARRRKLGW